MSRRRTPTLSTAGLLLTLLAGCSPEPMSGPDPTPTTDACADGPTVSTAEVPTFGAEASAVCGEPATDPFAAFASPMSSTAAAAFTFDRERECAAGTVSIHCGRRPSLAFDDDGRLWAVFEQDGHVHLTASDDLGATFGETWPVTPEPEAVEVNGEGRPKLALGPDGTVHVSWTRKLERRFTGEIRYSRRTDPDGAFEPVRTINDDGLAIGHRFDSLGVGSDGRVYLTWIDKRDREAARDEGRDYRGAALYSAVSHDGGAHFEPDRRVADHACECCRIALAPARDGGVAVLWRHIFDPNVRDHAFVTLDGSGDSGLVRATHEGWRVDGCPHHGPALARASGERYHMSWFTGARSTPTLYYGTFDPADGATGPVVELASGPVAHPSVADAGGGPVVAWKSIADDTEIQVRTPRDDGARWGPPRTVAATEGASDHPFLHAHDGRVYLSWHTEDEGFRVMPITSPVETGRSTSLRPPGPGAPSSRR